MIKDVLSSLSLVLHAIDKDTFQKQQKAERQLSDARRHLQVRISHLSQAAYGHTPNWERVTLSPIILASTDVSGRVLRDTHQLVLSIARDGGTTLRIDTTSYQCGPTHPDTDSPDIDTVFEHRSTLFAGSDIYVTPGQQLSWNEYKPEEDIVWPPQFNPYQQIVSANLQTELLNATISMLPETFDQARSMLDTATIS